MKKWFKASVFLGILVSLGLYSKTQYCNQYPGEKICVVTSPTPEPTPEPTAVPTASPSTPPTPVPTAIPEVTPSPATTFPVRLPIAGTIVYMRNARWNAGVDSTVRIRGDRELCEQLHHVPVPGGDCHLDSDVWQYPLQRAEYEAQIIGGCPVWQEINHNGVFRCHDDQGAVMSCDHFGSVQDRDDPKTPEVFEGKPAFCGNQRDEFGPYAGFFMVPQCGEECMVRACKPNAEGDNDTCAPWLRVDWR